MTRRRPPPAQPSGRLLDGELCAGPFLKIPSPEVTEPAGIARFDPVIAAAHGRVLGLDVDDVAEDLAAG